MLICAENHGKGRREKNFLAKVRENFCLCLTVCQKKSFLTSNGAFVKKFQSFDLKVKL